MAQLRESVDQKRVKALMAWQKETTQRLKNMIYLQRALMEIYVKRELLSEEMARVLRDLIPVIPERVVKKKSPIRGQ